MTPGLGKSNGRQESIPLTPGARSRFDTKKSSNGRLERVEFRRRISAILDVVGAFLRGVGSKKLADGGKDRVVGAGGGFSEPMLELGEDLLDRVQVRRIFRQEEKLRSGLSDGAAHSLAAMTAPGMGHFLPEVLVPLLVDEIAEHCLAAEDVAQ